MGRKRIKIEPIQGERNRTATFQKRKTGLFKKAHELAILTESNVAVIIFNNNGKISEFCSSNMEEFLLRYSDYSGTIERRGPEHFSNAHSQCSDTEELDHTLYPWKGSLHSNNTMQPPSEGFQQRRFSSDSSSMENSPQILPFPGSFPISDQNRQELSPCSVPIPPLKFSHTPSPLDLQGSSMSSEESCLPHSSAHNWHQVFQQGNRFIQPSITRMPNGRMVPGIPPPQSSGRRWSGGHELELSSQVPAFNSSFDERRLSSTALSYPTHHSHMSGDMLSPCRVMHSPVEQTTLGTDRAMSLETLCPVSNPSINMAALTQASDLSPRRSSINLQSPHSHTHSPISPTVTTPQGYPGSHPLSESMAGTIPSQAMSMQIPLVPNNGALQNISNPRLMTNSSSVSLPVYGRGHSDRDAPFTS